MKKYSKVQIMRSVGCFVAVTWSDAEPEWGILVEADRNYGPRIFLLERKKITTSLDWDQISIIGDRAMPVLSA